MGSYASLHYYNGYDEIIFASMFDYKFFGYIEDEECEKTESYKYLLQLKDIPAYILNCGYIGQVCVLKKDEALKFMMLYSKDYCIFAEREQFGKFYGWDREIDDLPEDILLCLCFD